MQLRTVKILTSTLLGVALSAASAQAQVTLVSQNRYVRAFSTFNPPECVQSTTIPANGFDPFNQTLTRQCFDGDIGSATQTSTLSPSTFSVLMNALTEFNGPNSDAEGRSYFEVVFDVAQNIPLTSTGSGSANQFRLVGPGVDRILENSENSVLAPGRYTLTCDIRAISGGSPGGFATRSINFGQPLPTYTIDWYTIDGGGVVNEIGGSMSLSGGIGQHDAGPVLSGGALTLSGGFWTMPTIPSGPICDSIDFNNDYSMFDPQDIDAFLSVYSEGPCIPATNTCNDIDFNNDGSLFDPCDIDSYLLVFSEGPCTVCGQ